MGLQVMLFGLLLLRDTLLWSIGFLLPFSEGVQVGSDAMIMKIKVYTVARLRTVFRVHYYL